MPDQQSALGPYRATVTFAGRDEIADRLRANVGGGGTRGAGGTSRGGVRGRLLDHAGRRLRLALLLGRAAPEETDGPASDPGTTELPLVAAGLRAHGLAIFFEEEQGALPVSRGEGLPAGIVHLPEGLGAFELPDLRPDRRRRSR